MMYENNYPQMNTDGHRWQSGLHLPAVAVTEVSISKLATRSSRVIGVHLRSSVDQGFYV
jgi:hypothetical protein